VIEVGINHESFLIGGRDRGYITSDVKPESSDTVIDIGAYRGRDTATFAKSAEKVIAYEPSPRNYDIAQENISRFSNVVVKNKGVWKEEGQLKIKYGRSPGDDGFLEPDSDRIETKETEIPVNTLEEHIKDLCIESVDFPKIEPEGAEPRL
jgi:FkbM family methyltransferase